MLTWIRSHKRNNLTSFSQQRHIELQDLALILARTEILPSISKIPLIFLVFFPLTITLPITLTLTFTLPLQTITGSTRCHVNFYRHQHFTHNIGIPPGRLRPEVQPLPLLYTILTKGTVPFVYLLFTNGTSFTYLLYHFASLLTAVKAP